MGIGTIAKGLHSTAHPISVKEFSKALLSIWNWRRPVKGNVYTVGQ